MSSVPGPAVRKVRLQMLMMACIIGFFISGCETVIHKDDPSWVWFIILTSACSGGMAWSMARLMKRTQ